MNIYAFFLLLPIVLVLLGLTVAAVMVPHLLAAVLALLTGWAELVGSFHPLR